MWMLSFQFLFLWFVLIIVSRASTPNNRTRECSNMAIFTHRFNCHLTVATNIAIYAINETQIYTSGVYTNYYRGYKYPSSCPTNRYGPACLYECNCEPEDCHIVLGCTSSDPSAADPSLALWVVQLLCEYQNEIDEELSAQYTWGGYS